VNSPLVITGSSGFIGSHLIDHFISQRIPAIALTRNANRTQKASEVVEVIQVESYSDYRPPNDAVLIHLAEPPHIAEVDKQGLLHVERMKEQALAIFERGYRRIVYSSTATLYGDKLEHPRRPEERILNQHNVYARSKMEVEAIVSSFGGVNARITNIYGPRMCDTTIFSDIIRQIGEDGPITIRESTPVREYLWIGDLCNGLARMALGEATGAFNLGTGQGISCHDLARLILEVSGQLEREVRSLNPPRRSILNLDIEDTMKFFDWSPMTSISTGIKTLLSQQ